MGRYILSPSQDKASGRVGLLKKQTRKKQNMNELALSGNGGALATIADANFWEEIGNEGGGSSIVGEILKFSKGDYTAGDKEIKPGTAMVANMDNLLMGWVRWQNKKPTDQIMARPAFSEKPKLRHELGDLDQSQWEIDPTNGKPKDPWQETTYLLLKATDGSGDLYTFVASSKGGRKAIRKLCTQFGTGSRMRPAEYPIIQLRVDSYKHDTYGKIFEPEIVIVGWQPKDQFEAATQAGAETTDLAPQQARSSREGYATADSNAVKF